MSAPDLHSSRGAPGVWPEPRFPEALRELLLRSERIEAQGEISLIGETPIVRWLRHAGRSMGFEGMVEEVSLSELDSRPARGPTLFVTRPPGGQASVAIAAIGSGRGGYVVLGPDGADFSTDGATLARVLTGSARGADRLGRAFASIPGGDVAFARLARDDVLERRSCLVARYELDAGRPMVAQLRGKGVGGRLVVYAVVATLEAIVGALAALTLGDTALTGVVDVGRVLAWSTLAASVIPLQYVESLLLGSTALDFAAMFKRRLLDGALFGEARLLAGQRLGVVLARLNEAALLEQTNPSDVVSALSPLALLSAGAAFLYEGARPGVVLAIFALFTAGAVALSVARGRAFSRCYQQRIDLTSDLVDGIVGHETRAVQQDPARWHVREDAKIVRYARASRDLDRLTIATSSFGRVWTTAAGGVLLWAFVLGAPIRPLLLSAIGIALVERGWFGALGVAGKIVGLLQVWRGVRPLFGAGSASAAAASGHDVNDGPLDTIVSSLSFAYHAGDRPVLSGVDLRIAPGERLLVEGPSGGGKTTLSKLITGELRPDRGSILVGGVEARSAPRLWRRKVAAAPQFHENYVFSNTFGFNVDPRAMDGEMSPEAYNLCRELGLGPLIDKMPAGTAQLVGETGWQLSHGERSRVFIARAVLQGARLIIFDESFAALDPESLKLAMACVRRRADTLIVIAHV